MAYSIAGLGIQRWAHLHVGFDHVCWLKWLERPKYQPPPPQPKLTSGTKEDELISECAREREREKSSLNNAISSDYITIVTDQKLTLWQSLFSLAVEHDIDARERASLSRVDVSPE